MSFAEKKLDRVSFISLTQKKDLMGWKKKQAN